MINNACHEVQLDNGAVFRFQPDFESAENLYFSLLPFLGEKINDEISGKVLKCLANLETRKLIYNCLYSNCTYDDVKITKQNISSLVPRQSLTMILSQSMMFVIKDFLLTGEESKEQHPQKSKDQNMK